jgi:quaternary ammonium compound-resistance protein SugE
MPWIWLLVAGGLEVAWAVGLKYTDGFRSFWPSAVTIVLMIGSFFALAQAIRGIPLGTGYAIWTGIGAVGTALLGMILFAESASPARLACLGLVIAGIAGLKLTSSTPAVPLPAVIDAATKADPQPGDHTP